jgi:hypothetical protein
MAIVYYFVLLAPSTADMNVPPQTYAYVMETFRWRPVTAGGMSHLTATMFAFLRRGGGKEEEGSGKEADRGGVEKMGGRTQEG